MTGAEIRQVRRGLKLRQDAFWAALGYSERQGRKIEQGEAEVPAAVARALRAEAKVAELQARLRRLQGLEAGAAA